jgi:hypothetical protein
MIANALPPGVISEIKMCIGESCKLCSTHKIKNIKWKQNNKNSWDYDQHGNHKD